jgi:hypothetical protein
LFREISYDEEEGEFEEGVERIFDPYYYLELGKYIITTVLYLLQIITMYKT